MQPPSPENDNAAFAGSAFVNTPSGVNVLGTAGLGSEQKPFHWLVSPLSGTGARAGGGAVAHQRAVRSADGRHRGGATGPAGGWTA